MTCQSIPVLHATGTREVYVNLPCWAASWRLQFPETIACSTGWFMDYPPFKVEWENRASEGLTYAWQADAGHVAVMRHFASEDLSGKLAQKMNLTGVRLRATVEPIAMGLRLELALTNTGSTPIADCVSDGGCFQALSPEFTGPNEPRRTWIAQDGQLFSLAEVSRSEPIRGMYHHAPETAHRLPWAEGNWFWGESDFHPDVPAVIGMQNMTGERCVAFGFQAAGTVSANSDEYHHCIHSSPSFGTLDPGQTGSRRGFIMFGSDMAELFQNLRSCLADAASENLST